MNGSEYYELPRVVPTPLGRNIERIRVSCVGVAAVYLVVVWVTEIWKAWSAHGVLAAIAYSLAISVVLAIVAVVIGVVGYLGKFSVAVCVLLLALILWVANAEVTVELAVPLVLVTVAAVASSWRKDEQNYRPIEPDLLARRVIGEPASGLGDAVEKFGVGNVTKGIQGEQLTSDGFDRRSDLLPDAQMINTLEFPGSEVADVDHAIVLGDRVALVDSKYWRGCNYQWADGTLITSGRGHELQSHEIHFGVAAARLAEMLGAEGKQVRAWVVIHSHDGRPVTVDIPLTSGCPTLVGGEHWVEDIASWLSEDRAAIDDTFRAMQCDTMKAVLQFKK
ncbi:NERD domain-containing protein [Gordonia sp. DT30]|uniref:NERD domain-containing protein n=1 Tax=Gordonia sp. DT30 TaxID=3416546 RepID=UPI003CF43A9E